MARTRVGRASFSRSGHPDGFRRTQYGAIANPLVGALFTRPDGSDCLHANFQGHEFEATDCESTQVPSSWRPARGPQ